MKAFPSITIAHSFIFLPLIHENFKLFLILHEDYLFIKTKSPKQNRLDNWNTVPPAKRFPGDTLIRMLNVLSCVLTFK